MAKAKKPVLNIPLYRLNMHRAFPEIPAVTQNTGDATRPVASLVLLAAYLMSGNKPALCEEYGLEYFFEELQRSCLFYNITPDFLMEWAESLLITPDVKPTAEQMLAVPRRMKGEGFDLKEYQFTRAGWAAIRKGVVLAHDPGAGKTATATAAAIAARKLGTCNDERCYIYCPVNAIEAWKPYCIDLREHYKDVHIISIDSASNAANQALDRTKGGAMIIDELHKMKSDTSDRGDAVERLRHGFQWGIGLTGTFLNTGIEGVVRTQDIACPGMSRFTNLWKFGEAFDAIYEKEFETSSGRTMTKAAVGMPRADREAAFNLYLSRGVDSLTFDSPEIRLAFNIKRQDNIRVNSWPMPDWAKELQKDLCKEDSRNTIYWVPDWTGDEAFTELVGAMALSVMMEDPFRELPSPSKIWQELGKEGRYDRVIQKKYVGGVANYSFLYNPSKPAPVPGDISTIPWGPKIDYVMEWLDKNPKESLVIGAVGTNTCLMMGMAMASRGIDFHLIDGRTKSKDRGKYKEEFQSGKMRVMLMQQAAGAESITLTKSSTSFLIDHNWSANTYKQFIRRTYRVTSQEDCEHYDLEFGRYQSNVVRRLIRGQAFDSACRRELEKGFWDGGFITRQGN